MSLCEFLYVKEGGQLGVTKKSNSPHLLGPKLSSVWKLTPEDVTPQQEEDPHGQQQSHRSRGNAHPELQVGLLGGELGHVTWEQSHDHTSVRQQRSAMLSRRINY